ncbi:MAG: arginine--tRNA ligase [Nanoarchaeota archaeon]
MNSFKEFVYNVLSGHANLRMEQIEIPPDKKLGDLAYPCFSLAKEWKMPPAKIAEELQKRIKPEHPIKSIENHGPYLNFFFNSEFVAEKTLLEPFYNKQTYPEKLMIEYSSPNTNKPLHLGHLRNIVLGSTVSTVEKSLGNKVYQACLVNDRGIHICKSMLMYIKHGGGEPDKKSDYFVGDYYVLYNQEVEKHPELEQEAQELLRRWEAGDKEVVKIWRKMNDWANKGFKETYQRLGIEFDKFYFESELYKRGKDIIQKGYEQGKLEEEDGAIIANMEKEKLGKKVLLRADGTSIYMTQDIYLAKRKFEDFDIEKSVYVVGSEQDMHFKQLFKILEILGFEFAGRCFHLSYGMVYLPEGKMKSREGTVVEADSLIEEMKNLAAEEIRKRHTLDEQELKKRAEKIGIAALRFFLLKTDPAKDVTYDPEKSISFEGETGPYVQYTYARISSILRKAQMPENPDFSCFGEEENDLVKKLAYFEETVYETKKHYRPSILCRYLLELCQQFNEYYHKVPVLNTEENKMKARVFLLGRIREAISEGLGLLRIETLEEM